MKNIKVIAIGFTLAIALVACPVETFGGQHGGKGFDEAKDVVKPDTGTVACFKPLLGIGKKTHGRNTRMMCVGTQAPR